MSKTTKFEGIPIAIVFSIFAFILVSIALSVAFGRTNSGLATVLAIIACTLFIAAVLFYIADKMLRIMKGTKKPSKKEE